MKGYPAIATIEFLDIPTGVYTTDAMIKRAPISVLRCGTISAGRYLTLVGGSTAAVEESYIAGVATGADGVADHLFLPDVHPALLHGIQGARQNPGDHAVAVLETDTVSATLRVAETALKGTDVALCEIRFADSDLHGKGFCVVSGMLNEVQAAVSLAEDAMATAGRGLTCRVITAPHEALAAELEGASRFGDGPFRGLDDGELRL